MVVAESDSMSSLKIASRRQFVSGLIAGASVYCLTPNLLAGCRVMPKQSSDASPETPEGIAVMDQALEILARTGPEYGVGLSNHGPMAAEALIRLGRPEAVIPWVELYKSRSNLQGPPEARNPISKKEWRGALGNVSRVGDWIAFFDRELKEASWRSVLGQWIPQLAPGLVAAATHGVIRTGHAVRSLAERETEARRQELARGLGYWAARYQPLLISLDRKSMGLKPSQAINEVKILPVEQRGTGGLIFDKLRRLDDFPPFATVADLVDSSGDASRFVSDLTETFAAVYVANAQERFTNIHAVTGPSAIRLLLPYVKPEAAHHLLRYGWQAAAGLYAAFGQTPVAGLLDGRAQSKEDLIDRAVATGDEHAIKFTEACLREYALNPKPVYLSAARHATDARLRKK